MQRSSLNLRCQAKFLATFLQVDTHITVIKFGGTSIKDRAAFDRVSRIVEAKKAAPLVVIVSAMSAVTDALIASFRGVLTKGVNESFAPLDLILVADTSGSMDPPSRDAQAQVIAGHVEDDGAEVREQVDALRFWHSLHLRLDGQQPGDRSEERLNEVHDRNLNALPSHSGHFASRSKLMIGCGGTVGICGRK